MQLPLRSPSSRGLGRRPLTAQTGVRIPVGTPSFSALAKRCAMPDRAFGPEADQRPATTSLARARAIFTGSAGHLVEWFDWYTYSAAALYFAPIFFPKGDQTAQLLQAAA